jgi:hypothetical protein
MISADGPFIDIPSTGAPSGHYQVHLNQSADNGLTWGNDMNLTNDPANTYYYPYMVRDSGDLHMTCVESFVGGIYLHSGDGGTTWDTPYSFGNSQITPFVAYTGCVVHIIKPDSGHIIYLRNPTGNNGPHCVTATGISSQHDAETRVTLQPNPFSNQAVFEISSPEKTDHAFLNVFDLVGQEILNTSFGNRNTFVLHRNNMNSGIYFYRVFQNDRLIATGKFIVE